MESLLSKQVQLKTAIALIAASKMPPKRITKIFVSPKYLSKKLTQQTGAASSLSVRPSYLISTYTSQACAYALTRKRKLSIPNIVYVTLENHNCPMRFYRENTLIKRF